MAARHGVQGPRSVEARVVTEPAIGLRKYKLTSLGACLLAGLALLAVAVGVVATMVGRAEAVAPITTAVTQLGFYLAGVITVGVGGQAAVDAMRAKAGT